MNWLARAALAALIVTPGIYAQAPESPQPADRPHDPEQALLRADANQDGKVSLEELRARRPSITDEAFSRMDTNSDGFLSRDDRAGTERGARGSGARPDAEARARMLERLLESDANGDGSVSFDELTASKPGFAKPDFDRFDRNTDGVISKEDMPRPPREGDRPRPPRHPEGEAAMRDGGETRAEFRARLNAADTSGDGKVTFGEAQAAFPQMTQERFNALDRNKNGSIGPDDRPQGANPRAGDAPKPPVE